MPECKRCVECNAEFHRKPGRSRAQWERARCCSKRCANAARNRKGPRRLGDLDRSQGKAAYQLAWLQRRMQPHWAAWWEAQRFAEDRAELDRVLTGGPCCRLRDRPRIWTFIAGNCPDCGTANVVPRGKWSKSIRCIGCTKARWRETHYARAQRYGVRFDVIDPRTIFERDDWRCGICQRKTRGVFPAPTSPTLDHIVPISKGGEHVRENLRCACHRCNSRKGNRAANDQLLLVG